MRLSLALILPFALSVGVARADSLVNYSFTGGSLAATSFDSVTFASASDVAPGSGSGFQTSFSTDWIYARASQTDNFAPNSSSTEYFGFTLTPQDGVTYDLSALTFDVAFYEEAGVANAYPTNYVVRSDLTGYDTDLLVHTEAGQTTLTPTFKTLSVALSDPVFTTISGTATFRIYIYDTLTGNTRLSAIDNISVLSVVPEPSSAATLAGLAALVLVATRRRVLSRRS